MTTIVPVTCAACGRAWSIVTKDGVYRMTDCPAGCVADRLVGWRT